MFVGRLLMKMSCKSEFSDSTEGGVCAANEILRETAGLFDAFCECVVFKGKTLGFGLFFFFFNSANRFFLVLIFPYRNEVGWESNESVNEKWASSLNSFLTHNPKSVFKSKKVSSHKYI